MKIENQVCTLDQAKKLLDLGIKPLSWLVWADAPDWAFIMPRSTGTNAKRYPAFTVAELGQMLPDIVDSPEERTGAFESFRSPTNGNWYCYAEYASGPNVWKSFGGSTQAYAVAAMLIYLLENNHVTAESVNKRLTDES